MKIVTWRQNIGLGYRLVEFASGEELMQIPGILTENEAVKAGRKICKKHGWHFIA